MAAFALTEQLSHVVQAAGLAPSVHYARPWRFVLRPEGLELHADPSLRMKRLDPDGRQLHVSCGAALFHARVAAGALGLAVTVDLLPDPSAPQHLANIRLTKGTGSSEDDLRLATAILHRQAFHAPLADLGVPRALVDRFRLDADAEFTRLQELSPSDTARALEQERSATEAVRGGQGRPRCASTLVHPASAAGATAAGHPAVFVLETDDDTPTSWLRAGQALGAILLRAVDHNVQAQPIWELTDAVRNRLGLRTVLGLHGWPQLVLRIGFLTRTAATSRRVGEDLLATVAG